MYCSTVLAFREGRFPPNGHYLFVGLGVILIDHNRHISNIHIFGFHNSLIFTRLLHILQPPRVTLIWLLISQMEPVVVPPEHVQYN